MIRNLNQLTIKDYGIIFPERSSNPSQQVCDDLRTQVILSRQKTAVFLTSSDTWFFPKNGMTVLSVSKDGSPFLHFYLDKPVCIHSGILFCLSAYEQETSQAEYAAELLPVPQDSILDIDDFQLRSQLQVGELYTFFYQEKERGFFFPGEAHPALELTYVDQGTLHSVADGQDLLLEAGDMVIYGSGQWHVQYADVDVAPRYVTISFSLDRGDLSQLLGKKFPSPQAAVTLLQQMLREQERMEAYSTDLIISLLNQLLLMLLRQSHRPTPKLKASNSLHSENEIILRAQQYILSHIRERLSVSSVARMADVSPSYLTALFHKNLQISPGEYIRRTKLQESKQMIRENSMNFTEIAAALQYSTVHHFSRQFKDKFGITPTEYARSVR